MIITKFNKIKLNIRILTLYGFESETKYIFQMHIILWNISFHKTIIIESTMENHFRIEFTVMSVASFWKQHCYFLVWNWYNKTVKASPSHNYVRRVGCKFVLWSIKRPLYKILNRIIFLIIEFHVVNSVHFNFCYVSLT